MMHYRKKMLFSGGALLAGFIALLFLFLDQSIDRFLTNTGMPSAEINLFVDKFKRAILILGGGFLFLFSLSTWFLFSRFSHPLQKITDHILSFAETDVVPSAPLDSMLKGEFGKIASILNALTSKIKKQMDHLKLAHKETEEILEALAEGVIAVDSLGKLTFANDAACKILGASRNQLLSSPLNRIEIGQKSLALQCHEIIQDVLQTSELSRQTWSCGTNIRKHLELSAAPRPGHRGVILVLQDKTSDFKVLEMGKDFIANASHELRTPITIIRGFAETLHDLPELSPQMLKEITDKIVRTSHRLENLVKSLLTLAEIENFSKERLQMTDLVSIAEHCKQFAMTAHKHPEISFQTDQTTVPILGDPDLLDLAIVNLLENAIKYSKTPAQIKMSIESRGNEVRLSVQDQGIGIPEADLPHVFERFYTVDKARSHKSGGTGLGLSIVKTILEKHMGSVSASSQLGTGSTFTIHLNRSK